MDFTVTFTEKELDALWHILRDMPLTDVRASDVTDLYSAARKLQREVTIKSLP